MNSDRRGVLGTILFHGILMLIFLIFGFTTPLPLPGEQGILINFGDEESGFGNEEPMNSEMKSNRAESQPEQEQVDNIEPDKAYLTQEHEEAVSLKKADKTIEKKSEKKVQPVKKETEITPKKVEKTPVQPVTDSRALYSGKKTNTQSTGSEGDTEGTGNQGNPDGSPDTDYRGTGGGSGNTPDANLIGRNALTLPIPQIDSQVEGKVVVEIKVDRSGNVISAVPGVKGSTTVDSYLLKVSKTAALSSRFDSKDDAEPVQKGTITYTYRLH